MSPLMISVSGVRGIVGAEFNPVVVATWAAAMAELLDPGPVVLGRDSRRTGAMLSQAAAAVLCACGREVLDSGIVPTPTVQMAVEQWDAAGGLILSASHNPAPWNALKFVDRGGSFLAPERFAALRARVEAGAAPFAPHDSYGTPRDRREDALAGHRAAILAAVDVAAIRAARLRVWIDTGHGAGGALLPALAEDLGVELTCVREETSGAFAENPEPSEAALKQFLAQGPREASFAAMADPDADRFALALPGTGVVGEEWTLPVVDLGRMERSPGTLVTNLSTSTRMDAVAVRHGVERRRTPVGEAHVVAEMRRAGAVLGGEGSGGVIGPAVHLGRDAAVAFARLCESEATVPGGLRALAEALPPRVQSKAKIAIPAGGLAGVAGRLLPVLGEPDDRRDGLRWSRPDGFVHVRASGTEPVVRILVEAAAGPGAGALMESVRGALDRG